MRRSETGQTTILVIGLSLVAFAVSGVAVDGTRAFLHRRTLQNAADAAAVAAAGEIDTAAYYASGGREVRLDIEGARRQAARVLAARGIAVESSMSVDRGGVSVGLSDRLETTFLGAVGIATLPVAAESHARPIEGTAP